MPCTAPSRNNLGAQGPCGKPVLTTVQGVDVSAASLCAPHWMLRNGTSSTKAAGKDEFTRADETPVAGGWGGVLWNGNSPMKVVGNQLVPTPGIESSVFWNTLLPPDQEVSCTIVDPMGPAGSGYIDLAVRQVAPGSGAVGFCTDGYCIGVYSDGHVDLEKVFNNTWIQLVPVNPVYPFSQGDVVTVRAQGNVISALVNGVVVSSAIDNDIRGSGYVGLVSKDKKLDNFYARAL